MDRVSNAAHLEAIVIENNRRSNIVGESEKHVISPEPYLQH
jgi:hypothetical protein